MLTLGIDIGSLSTDAVLINEKREIVAYEVIATGASSKKACDKIFKHILDATKLEARDLDYVVATGYGRIKVPFANEVVTEITCHAKGANYFFPDARTVIDIGGQDSKAIKLDAKGNVLDFSMNDKCAAGTGRFLEVMARTLEIELDEMGELSLTGKDNVSISSLCTVFAESEVVSLIGADHKTPDICRALHISIAKRVSGQAKRVGLEESVVMTGGVAKNIGVVRELEKKLLCKIKIAEEPQIIGALGAALIALENARATPKRKSAEKADDSNVSISDVQLDDNTMPKIGYFCTYTPVEIIRAAGYHPVRIKGINDENGAAGESLLCSNICSYIKTLTDKKVSGDLDHLEGLVFTNSCDGMRRLYDAWIRIDKGEKFNYFLDIPKNSDDASVQYFADEIQTFKERLENHFKLKIQNEDINRTISLYNGMRDNVTEFLQKQWNGYVGYSGYEIYTLLMKGINAVPEKFQDYVSSLTSLMKKIGDVSEKDPVPKLFIWGSIMENEEIVKMIEDAGARVVSEDFCTGSRYFDRKVEITDNPYKSIAERYLKRSPCSRMVDVFGRIKGIVSLIERRAISGAIYHSLKFCDHTLYDYPLVKEEFEKKHIPLLHINCDSAKSDGQTKTRIEAFIEQLTA
ncbi:MAG: acyl-CoA dehydratase activase [Candidatus Scalindua sp.]|nr:acyl-CoA dehydratase activase [Candidatus Scalindua sp.]MCR4345508.1 acyl-CoA dehydratase activase [Candidatus Scalindua sp.]